MLNVLLLECGGEFLAELQRRNLGWNRTGSIWLNLLILSRALKRKLRIQVSAQGIAYSWVISNGRGQGFDWNHVGRILIGIRQG